MRPIFHATPFDAMILHLEVNNCQNHIKIKPLGPCMPVVRFAQWLVKDLEVRAVFICLLFTRLKPQNFLPELYEERFVKIWRLCWPLIF